MSNNPFSIEGKVAIVTGTSTGLGRGIALAYAKAGATVIGVNSSLGEETKRLVEELGVTYKAVQMDLIHATKEELITMVQDVAHEFGHVDILVNNAGIIRREDILNYSEQDWKDVLAINLDTVFFLTQAVANQFMLQKTKGKIINIASMLSYQGGIRVPAYTASKSAVKGLTMSFANELAKYNINVNAIAPGYMVTNNTKALREDEDRSNQILERIPAGRWGDPSDIGNTAVFLASEASDYIHGFTIAVDGGWLAR